MPPLKLLHLLNPFWPTHFHRFSCMNPNRPLLEQPLERPPITVTSRRTSTPSSSFHLLPALYPQQTPTNRLPLFPQPAVPSPQHHPIPRQPPTNSHMIDGNTSTSSPHPLSPYRNSHTLLRHFPPPSAAHRATDVPRHLLAPLPPPAHGSRIHAPAPPRPNVRPQPPTHSQQLQSILFQSDPHHHFIKPNNIMLPLNPSNLSPQQPAGLASKADPTHPPHQWHHRQPLPQPPTRGQHITTFQHNNPSPSSHHKPVPQTWLHHPQWSCSNPPRQEWTRRGAPCHYHNRTMTPIQTRGMQTTIDQAAAASEAPFTSSPRMIHPITSPTHTPYVVFMRRPVFTTTFYKHVHHHLRTSAQLTQQTNTLSFTSHNEKRCVPAASQTLTMDVDQQKQPHLLSAVFQFSQLFPDSFFLSFFSFPFWPLDL